MILRQRRITRLKRKIANLDHKRRSYGVRNSRPSRGMRINDRLDRLSTLLEKLEGTNE